MYLYLFKLTLLLYISFVSCKPSGAKPSVNDRPIVGIYTQPASGEIKQFGQQFIAASYVKYIESAGARVVPIRYTLSEVELKELFQSIDGILLPGGGVDFGTEHEYWQSLSYLFDLAIQANQHGDFFPMWGTCMGFQELSLLVSQNMSLLTMYDSENLTLPLEMTPIAFKSRMFSEAPQPIMSTLMNQPVTMNNHHYGVSPDDFHSNKYLVNFFNILSTNVDRVGNEFISTIEGKSMPIYGSQWHPEKIAFEWNINEVINHSVESLMANQYVGNFFVNEARKCNHTFDSVEQETAALIYNYQPVYIYPYVNDFEQGYFFN